MIVNRRKTKDGNYVWKIEGVRDFDSRHIFDCGQCFRWREQSDGSWTGIAGGRIANIDFEASKGKGSQGVLRIKSLAGTGSKEDFEDFWRSYLDLDTDYGRIKRDLSRDDDIMKTAVRYGSGIRILNQDLWEVIVSFIISQNNNIPRIKGCIERLAELAGKPVVGKRRISKESSENELLHCIALGKAEGERPSGSEILMPYSIPGPKKLASMKEGDLAPVRLGYRARYLIETAKAVCKNGLPGTTEELNQLCGVGPKVANCISLFGLKKYESFPIDVWMKRVMHELYGFNENDVKGMTDFAEKNFGALSGVAQQYLFYYMRDKNT